MRRKAYEFALEAGVGEPFDTDAVTDLYRRILSVLADSDDFTDTLVTTDEGAFESQHAETAEDKIGTNVTPEIGQSSFLTCRSGGG